MGQVEATQNPTRATRAWGAPFHGGLFLSAVALVAWASPAASWPWYLLIPLLLYAGVVLVVPFLRRTIPPLPRGRVDGGPLLFAGIVTLLTSVVLITFHIWVQPDVKEMGAKLPVAFFGNVLIAGLGFSVINAALEEVVFRGILWDTIAMEWNRTTALVVTSILFGLGHMTGYPPGPLGSVLAGLYGMSLRILRWWTGGLGLALACHVVADITIFCLLQRSGAIG